MQSQITVTDTEVLERIVTEKDDDTGKEEKTKTCSKEIYDDCINEMLNLIMRKNTEDECRAPFVRDDNERICTKPKDINTTFWISMNRSTNQKKDCLIPCRSLKVNLGAKNYVKKNVADQEYGQLFLYYDPRVTKNIEHRLYTILSLFAEIGGYVGLLLGYSVFNLATWISGIILRKVSRYHRQIRN